MGGELTVRDHLAGEELDVRSESTDRLAAFLDNADQFVTMIGDMRRVAENELLDRMDRETTWTHHLRVGDTEYTIQAPSPTAGTTAYDEKKLYRSLAPLVKAGIISRATLEGVVRRKVTVSAEGYDTAALEQLAAEQGYGVTSSVGVHKPSLGKLAKLSDPQVKEAIAGAATSATVEAKNRRVKVEAKTKR